MKTLLLVLIALVALATTAFGQAAAPPKAPTTHLKVGDTAPDFTLTDTTGKPVKLGDYRGKTVVLAFYVLAFTGG